MDIFYFLFFFTELTPNRKTVKGSTTMGMHLCESILQVTFWASTIISFTEQIVYNLVSFQKYVHFQTKWDNTIGELNSFR